MYDSTIKKVYKETISFWLLSKAVAQNNWTAPKNTKKRIILDLKDSKY